MEHDDIQISTAAIAARNEAVAAMLRGGSLRFYAGAKAGSTEDEAGERPELVRVEIPDSRLAVRADTKGLLARGLAKAVVAAEGQPTWWRGVARDGRTVIQGRVTTGEDAARAFQKSDSFRGVAVDLPVLYRGMEFDLPELRIDLGVAAGSAQ